MPVEPRTGRRITERLAELAAEDERIDVIERTSAVALFGATASAATA